MLGTPGQQDHWVRLWAAIGLRRGHTSVLWVKKDHDDDAKVLLKLDVHPHFVYGNSMGGQLVDDEPREAQLPLGMTLNHTKVSRW